MRMTCCGLVMSRSLSTYRGNMRLIIAVVTSGVCTRVSAPAQHGPQAQCTQSLRLRSPLSLTTMATPAAATPVVEEGKLLSESLSTVKIQVQQMRRYLVRLPATTD